MAQKRLFCQWYWWLFIFLDKPFTNFVQSGQLFLNVFHCSWLEEFNVQGVMATQNHLVRSASNKWNLSHKFHIMLTMTQLLQQFTINMQGFLFRYSSGSLDSYHEGTHALWASLLMYLLSPTLLSLLYV